MATIKVLSIDGGGIRGVVPAMILAEIEERTGKPISALFQLIAGTSTGGILALGLSKPGAHGNPDKTAEDMVKLYETEGGRIFTRSVWRRIHTAGGFAEEKYPSDGIEEVLDRYFGEARLKDALTDVLITSYEIERRIPWLFKSRVAKQRTNYDFPMKQVARATSAAPTYFEPVKIETSDSSEYWALIDGGVFANNPAMCAYVEARSTFGDDENDFLVVSLGTGEMTRSLPYDEVKGWGLAKWAQPIVSVIFDGVNDTVDYQLKHLLPPNLYYRFQASLTEDNDAMDDATRRNIRALKLLAEGIIRDNGRQLNALCGQLI
jgi:patatin-like phospholipase/acyl hydrolase